MLPTSLHSSEGALQHLNILWVILGKKQKQKAPLARLNFFITPMNFFIVLVSYSIIPCGKRDTNLSVYSQALEGETLPTMLSIHMNPRLHTTQAGQGV